MNIVYESPTMIVHDDREPITQEQAFELLWQGKSVRICYPPDYSAENESDIYDSDYPLHMTDIFRPEDHPEMIKEKCRKKVYQYLRGYEIYR